MACKRQSRVDPDGLTHARATQADEPLQDSLFLTRQQPRITRSPQAQFGQVRQEVSDIEGRISPTAKIEIEHEEAVVVDEHLILIEVAVDGRQGAGLDPRGYVPAALEDTSEPVRPSRLVPLGPIVSTVTPVRSRTRVAKAVPTGIHTSPAPEKSCPAVRGATSIHGRCQAGFAATTASCLPGSRSGRGPRVS